MLELWVATAMPESNALIAGVVGPHGSYFRYFDLRQRHPGIELGGSSQIVSSSPVSAETWHLLAVTDDGNTITVYVDGVAAGSGRGELAPEI